MTTDQIDAAISGLNRIRNRLYQADLLTRRARTPGREQHLENYGDLSGWDATQLRLAYEIGIDLSSIARAVEDDVNEMVENWKPLPSVSNAAD
ncbi:MAG: hypothetical protein IT186_21395 [Acidobacteria bacterium]|jgi:hypothetical protein|nr:hypothetical protein [Acidobacteriota bacterium]